MASLLRLKCCVSCFSSAVPPLISAQKQKERSENTKNSTRLLRGPLGYFLRGPWPFVLQWKCRKNKKTKEMGESSSNNTNSLFKKFTYLSLSYMERFACRSHACCSKQQAASPTVSLSMPLKSATCSIHMSTES